MELIFGILNPAIKNADYILKILENFVLLIQYGDVFHGRMKNWEL
jgi:hypothetical protein